MHNINLVLTRLECRTDVGALNLRIEGRAGQSLRIYLREIAFHGLGLNGLKFIFPFLQGRKQCVLINDIQRNLLETNTGIPQGSLVIFQLMTYFISLKMLLFITLQLFISVTFVGLPQTNFKHLDNTFT